MKRMLKLSIIAVVLLTSGMFLFMSCNNLADLSDEDLQNLETLLGASFDSFDPETDVYPPRGITGTGANDFTVSWLNYTYSTITVNGSLVITMTPETATTGKATVVGTLTFSGSNLPIETLKLDITVSYDLADLNPANMTFKVSGTVTIDGVEYDAAGLTDQNVIKLIKGSFMSMIPTL